MAVQLTHTGAQLDSAIRKFRATYADVSNVDLLPSEARSGKKYVSASKILTTGTMPNAVITPQATVNASVIDDSESDFPVTIRPSAIVGTPGFCELIPAGSMITKYIQVEEKTATPSNVEQNISPASGKLLNKVTINPTPTEEKTVTANGNVTPSYGKFLSKVIVNVQPRLQSKTITPTTQEQTISPDSSYDGLSSVVVRAVTTTQPTLNAPSITLSGSIITISNPSSNGNFVVGYRVYKDGSQLATTSSTTLDLANYITESGTYSITVKAYGTNFKDSAASNAVTYTKSSGYQVSINCYSPYFFPSGSSGADVYVYLDNVQVGILYYSVHSKSYNQVYGTGSVISFRCASVFDGITITMGGQTYNMSSRNTSLTLTGDAVITGLCASCLTADALITMSDGSEKEIRNLTPDDTFISYDFETGNLVQNATVKYMDMRDGHTGKFAEQYQKYTFSDGTVIKEVHMHRFFNMDKRGFYNLCHWDIGDHIYKIDGSTPSLVSVETIEERIEHFAVTTYHYHNGFANGCLYGDRFAQRYKIVIGEDGKPIYDMNEIHDSDYIYGKLEYDD